MRRQANYLHFSFGIPRIFRDREEEEKEEEACACVPPENVAPCPLNAVAVLIRSFKSLCCSS